MLSIRPADAEHPADAETIGKIVASAFGPVMRAYYPPDAENTLGRYDAAWALRDQQRGFRWFIGENSAGPVGCISLWQQHPGRVEPKRLAVLPEHQHEGVGRALLDHAINQAECEGIEHIDISLVKPNTALCEWYRAMGFQWAGTVDYQSVPFPVGWITRRVDGQPAPAIRILGPGDEPALERFLLPHEDTSMFLLGNMRAVGLKDEGKQLHATYAAAFDGDDIISVAAHSWQGMVLTQAPVHLPDVVRAAITASGRNVHGLNGKRAYTDAVMDLFDLPPEGDNVRCNEAESLFALDLATFDAPDQLAQGCITARRWTTDDVDPLVPMVTAYLMEAINRPSDTDQMQKDLQDAAEKNLARWVLYVDDELVATCTWNARTDRCVQIGGVYTKPEHRGKGYARCVVAQSLLDARDQGVSRSVLFTGDENPAAIRAYESLGYQKVDEYRLYMMKKPVKV